MAIRYSRDYDLILDDLSHALSTAPDFYRAFEMEAGDWAELDDAERNVCIRTLADDMFYALGDEPRVTAGSALLEYDREHAVIKVTVNPQLTHLISLKK